jgi:hypothetical protein
VKQPNGFQVWWSNAVWWWRRHWWTGRAAACVECAARYNIWWHDSGSFCMNCGKTGSIVFACPGGCEGVIYNGNFCGTCGHEYKPKPHTTPFGMTKNSI